MKQYFYATCIVLLTISLVNSSEEVASEFDKIDIDHDGYISHSEFHTDEQYSQQWLNSDADKDDRLNRSEFEAYILQEQFVPIEQFENEC